MRSLLRAEHWIIQTFKFDRMTTNVLWLAVAVVPIIIGIVWWLLGLHEQPNTEVLILRDPAITDKVADVFYDAGQFYVAPLQGSTILHSSSNGTFQAVSAPVTLQEDDQLVVGHTIFQVRQLDDWTPHLRIIGYYLPDRELHDGVSLGRSMQPEEANGWRVNEVIVRDSTIEPVHFRISPSQQQWDYRVTNLGQTGVYVSVVPEDATDTRITKWLHVMQETEVAVGQYVAAGASTFQLIALPSRAALALKIVQGVRSTYGLSREAHNVIGGLQMIPEEYIPDYLVDEEFIEYVRQAIEQGIFSLDASGKELRIRGFDATGTLVQQQFDALTDKQKFLLHKIFRFREKAGIALRWRRPFNREGDDSYAFVPENIENFIINAEAGQVTNIYRYAAHLTNPHTIAAEVATERGEIFDRNRYTYPRLWAYADPATAPVAELLLVPTERPDTQTSVNTKKAFDHIIYVAGGYRFSDGTTIRYERELFQMTQAGTTIALSDGAEFRDGQYTFRYARSGQGFLAQNIKDNGGTRRYYPLGQRLAHIVGYSYAKSQFKGNLEKVFDHVLLGKEKQPPWWSLQRSTRAPGNNLILTIDDDLERVVYAELLMKLNELNARYKTDQFKGAAIVLNREGEILASASIPSYDPNNLHSILAALKESSEDNWNSSYINRATHKSYPPGSTMKVIMSTIALDNKQQFLLDVGDGQYMIRDDGHAFACTGWLSSFNGISFGRYGIPDFGGDSHGPLTLDAALTKSCNNTFAFLALSAGHKIIQTYAERYGFNQSFDFLPYSVFKDDVQLASNITRDVRDPLASLPSQVPDPGDDFKITQLARMGIGQWEILATPLQMATVAMTVGNLGERPYPHLLKGIEDRATSATKYLPYPAKTPVFAADTLRELIPMMQHVVQKGSAIRMTRSTIPYYSLKDHVAGKTGTAEQEDQNRHKVNVVWFISFAPVENPQLAIAVVIERGKIISGEAVEVARGIWEKAVLLYPELFFQE